MTRRFAIQLSISQARTRSGAFSATTPVPPRAKASAKSAAGIVGRYGFPISQRTVRVADPLIPPDFAAIVAVPALSPVASPLPLIEATGFGDDDQVTALVRSPVLPLL